MYMKALRKLFTVAVAAAMVTAVNAQTWSFDAAEWSTNCGSADIDTGANTITAKSYEWGCVGLVYNGTKTVGAQQDRLCLTGRYLSKSDNGANPNLNSLTLGASQTQVCASQLRAEKVNGSQTLIVFNLAEKFASIAEGDREADGTIKVSNMGFYINETKVDGQSLMFVVNDVKFLTSTEADALAASMENSGADPFTFNPAQWTCVCGSFDTEAEGCIRAASYEWGCLGIQFSSRATVPSVKSILVVKGKNIVDGSSNPNIDELEIDGTKVNGGQLRMTVNKKETIAYADLSSLFSAQADKQLADGSLLLTKLKMYLQATADDAMLEVDDIRFVTNDELQLMLMEEEDVPDYSFNATDWTCTCGGFAVDGQAIKSTGYEWGCVGFSNKTMYRVDIDKNQLVVSGENLQQGSNNPCVYALKFSGADQLNGSKPLLTANANQAMAVISLEEYFDAAADKAKDGQLTLTELGLYLQETADKSSLTVSSIDFMTKAEVEALTTGIEEIVNSKLSNGKYFDLQGRRVSQPTKGLYIINGKKIAIN